ncbi:MAG: hypothetical protein HFF84_07455 [Oscillibacter sp.]|nr:hypothetical protein [Oscillibacter sp.]
MPSIYERLFELYGDAVLKDCNCCKSDEINQFTSALGVEDDMEVVISDYLVDSYYRWSTNAFALGLHLGLSLLNGNVSGIRPQKGE